MKESGVIWIASSSYPEDPKEAENFYQWLEGKHLPDLLKFKGLKKATCYRKVTDLPPLNPTAAEYPGYITVYEFESKQACRDYETCPERAAAIKDGKTRWPGCGEKIWSVLYEPVKTVKRQREKK